MARGRRYDSRPRSRRQRDPSRSRSRSDIPIRRAPKPAASESLSATCEIVDGAPKSGESTWRAEVSLPRPAAGRFKDMKESFIIIRGPSRVSKKDAEEDGDKLVDSASKRGMDGCRKMQRELNSLRLSSGRAENESRGRSRS
mmetsp:Transcript_1162/g.1630  ORF Transcript_1162/g.1630 Transcript_1162/m.1630 type:complete len:142 (-) Transcript_1162:152-577(-)